MGNREIKENGGYGEVLKLLFSNLVNIYCSYGMSLRWGSHLGFGCDKATCWCCFFDSRDMVLIQVWGVVLTWGLG